MTATAVDVTIIKPLAHHEAMRHQALELERTLPLLRSLHDGSWAAATDCPAWDVRAMYQHALGACETGAPVRENIHQPRAAPTPAAQVSPAPGAYRWTPLNSAARSPAACPQPACSPPSSPFKAKPRDYQAAVTAQARSISGKNSIRMMHWEPPMRAVLARGLAARAAPDWPVCVQSDPQGE